MNISPSTNSKHANIDEINSQAYFGALISKQYFKGELCQNSYEYFVVN